MRRSLVDRMSGNATFFSVSRAILANVVRACLRHFKSSIELISREFFIAPHLLNICDHGAHESRDGLKRNLTFFFLRDKKDRVDVLITVYRHSTEQNKLRVIKNETSRHNCKTFVKSHHLIVDTECLIIPLWCLMGNKEDERREIFSTFFAECVHCCFSFSFASNYSFKCLHFSPRCYPCCFNESFVALLSRFNFCLRSRHAEQFSLSKCFEILAI